MGSAEGTRPWAWGKRQQVTRKADTALTASIQQRFLFDKVLNHTFKRALMDVSMASSILLNGSVGRKRTREKCGAECEHQWPVKAAPACQLFVVITSGYTWIIPVSYFSCVLNVMKITKYPQTHHHFFCFIDPHIFYRSCNSAFFSNWQIFQLRLSSRDYILNQGLFSKTGCTEVLT